MMYSKKARSNSVINKIAPKKEKRAVYFHGFYPPVPKSERKDLSNVLIALK
jgi:hypothetical protein